MGWIRFQIIPASDTVARVKLNGQVGDLNGGGTLTAGCIYEFDITVKPGDKVNLRLSVAQTPYLLRIMKVIV